MFYITGDTHRDFTRVHNLPKGSTLIILGDVGINYFLNEEDKELKEYLNSLDITFLCIQGNHEERPENIPTYKENKMYGGKVFIEDDYPNLIFLKNGEIYTINNKKVLVLGGAYSIDKNIRLLYGWHWFKDEQLSKSEMNTILEKYQGTHVDVILSHTSPKKFEPVEVFLSGIDQKTVDKTMEEFLDTVEETIKYDKWYCGHYHTEKIVDKIEFMFENIKEFR